MVFEIEDISNDSTASIQGRLKFYHYQCDGYDDRGWGCGYRTLQSLASWIINVKEDESDLQVPSIESIQQILVDLNDKSASFLSSDQWIGTYEVTIVLNQLYNVGKIRLN
jgi:Ufm1-specific protease 1